MVSFLQVKTLPGAAGLPAGMIAVRAADVACPGGAAGPGALVASSVPVASGEMLVFTCPVTVAPGAVTPSGACPRVTFPQPQRRAMI